MKTRIRDMRLMDHAKRLGLLTIEQEHALGERIKAGDTDARNKLVEHNMLAVITEAKRYGPERYNFDDLVFAGLEGLIRAATDYDPAKIHHKAKFIAYAKKIIQHRIEKALHRANTVYMSAKIHSEVQHVVRIIDEARDENRNPSDDEILEKLRDVEGITVDVDRVLAGYRARHGIFSMNTIVHAGSGGSGACYDEFVIGTDGRADLNKEAEQEEAEWYARHLESLTAVQRDVIERRFGFECEPETLREIGVSLGVTKERIRQIETKALERLRRKVWLDQLGRAA